MDAASEDGKLTVYVRELEETIRGAKWRANMTLSWSNESINLDINNPATIEEEAIIYWFLEKYAIDDPFNAGKATEARKILHRYGRTLYQTLFGSKDLPSFSRLLIIVEAAPGYSQFQKLHWELIEEHIR
jgi:hypothetical protein